jgi:uncharacterized protein (DUF2249 family)
MASKRVASFVWQTLRRRDFRQLDTHQENPGWRAKAKRYASLDTHQGARAPGIQQCDDDRDTTTTARAFESLMAREHLLDVRSLEPPEPFERVMDALDGLGPGDRLKVVIDRRPDPLFRVLERNGFAHCEAPGKDSLLEITIWRKD